jgi:hypothetical protein
MASIPVPSILRLIKNSHTGLRENALAYSGTNLGRLDCFRRTGETLLRVGSFPLRAIYILTSAKKKRAAALATSCEIKLTFERPYLDLNQNQVLGRPRIPGVLSLPYSPNRPGIF